MCGDGRLGGSRFAGAVAFVVAFFLALAASSPGVRAATADPLAPVLDDPIARTLDRCLANPKVRTTLDIEACFVSAIGAYDALLRIVYPAVLEHLDPESRKLVARSQVAWIAARSATRAAEGAPWRTERGTIVGIEILQNEARAVRERIVALDLYWPGYPGETPLSLTPPRSGR